METVSQPVQGFGLTGLSPVILQALERANFTTPTPIQAAAIPVAIAGGDVLGIAQTGTGKTMAFGLPIIQKLTEQPGRALVVVPTRELALQVEESIRKVTRFINHPLRTISLIGGMPIYRQIKDLKTNPRVIIATPGRLQDHIDQKTVSLNDVKVFVLDEADRMFDMGFAPQIKKICASLPTERQTMLFSATMPPEIASLAAQYMRSPERIEVARAGSSNAQIDQELCYVSHDNKTDVLRDLLIKHEGTVLVFSRTKHGASKLSRKVQDMGHTAAEIHSNRSLGQRRQALDGFKNGRYRVLVATDVAARGIDVKDIEVVINYDLPDAAEDYVHRIGRTGRAGKTGRAISLATHDQYKDVKAIERLISKELPLSEHSEQPRPQMRFERSTSRQEPRRFQGSQRGTRSEQPRDSRGGSGFGRKPFGGRGGNRRPSGPKQFIERNFNSVAIG